MIPDVDGRSGGLALALGYVLFVVVLFRNPSSALSAATTSLQGIVFFLAFPVLGFASGVYAYVGGALSSAGVVAGATYLAAIGLSFALPLTDVGTALSVLGVVLFALAAVALVGTARSAVATIGLGELSPGAREE